MSKKLVLDSKLATAAYNKYIVPAFLKQYKTPEDFRSAVLKKEQSSKEKA